MKQFIDKLNSWLEEEREFCLKENALISASCIYRIKERVNQLAEEYKNKTNWQIIYDKVVSLEYEYAKNGKEDAVNDCIRLENLLQFFKEKLQSEEEYKGGWISVDDRLPEKNDSVLCWAKSTARGGDVCFVGSCHNGFWFCQSSADTHSFPGQYVIVAWKPIEPYQKEGE